MVAGMDDAHNRIDAALDIAHEYGQIDGAHHKAWVIDQMVRSLLGEHYNEWVHGYCFDEATEEQQDNDDPEYEWDEGIAP
jgi:hypothetical protein